MVWFFANIIRLRLIQNLDNMYNICLVIRNNMKIKIIILALTLAAGFYYRADILELLPLASQKMAEIEKAGTPGFNKIKENVADIVSDKSRDFPTSPLKITEKAPGSSLTQKGIITETNNRRKENNLSPLEENIKLNEAAKAKVLEIFKSQYSGDGSSSDKGPAELAKDAGYDYLVIGENAALGSPENDKKLTEAWMRSIEHKANILNDQYTQIGVAVEKGLYEGKSVWVAVEEFGRPASVYSKTGQALKTKIDEVSEAIEEKKAELENTEVISKNISEYNDKINAYNNLIQQYNTLITETKDTVTGYDNKVRAYRECLK